jgi:hypothetical protein
LLSPFAAPVLVETGGPQRGTSDQVRYVIQGLQPGVQGIQGVLLLALLLLLPLSLLAPQGIPLGRQLRNLAGPDILTDHTTVNLA